jgi:hypothetical protein
MPATRSIFRHKQQGRRKKPGLISGAATKVAALATSVGSKIGATVREPAAQIASFVHDTAQHLPLIGQNGSAPKHAGSKTRSAAAHTKRKAAKRSTRRRRTARA